MINVEAYTFCRGLLGFLSGCSSVGSFTPLFPLKIYSVYLSGINFKIEISHFLKFLKKRNFKNSQYLPNRFLFRLLSGIIFQQNVSTGFQGDKCVFIFGCNYDTYLDICSSLSVGVGNL